MAGAVAWGQLTAEPQLKSSFPGQEEQALTEATYGFLHSSSYQLAKCFVISLAAKVLGRGAMSRTMTGYIVWKAILSIYCNQTDDKWFPFSQGFSRQVLNVSFNA